MKPARRPAGICRDKKMMYSFEAIHHFKSSIDHLVADIGQQSQVAGTLDGDGQLALMLRAGAGHATGDNLRTLRDESSQAGDILIIDILNAVNAEGADFLSAFSAAMASFRPVGLFVRHNLNLL